MMYMEKVKKRQAYRGRRGKGRKPRERYCLPGGAAARMTPPYLTGGSVMKTQSASKEENIRAFTKIGSVNFDHASLHFIEIIIQRQKNSDN